MPKRSPTVLVAAAVLAFSAVLTGCGASGGGDPAPTRSAKEEGPGPAPSPDAAQKKKLIDSLKAVDPQLAEPESRALKGSLVTCEALANGVPRKAVAGMAASNFGVDPSSVERAEADRIVAAVESSFCKGKG